jgi:hypothetical protein
MECKRLHDRVGVGDDPTHHIPSAHGAAFVSLKEQHKEQQTSLPNFFSNGLKMKALTFLDIFLKKWYNYIRKVRENTHSFTENCGEKNLLFNKNFDILYM